MEDSRSQEILRYQATVTTNAAPPELGTTGNGLYGSTTLILFSFSSDQLTSQTITMDLGLIALAYAGDSIGNGTLSFLDASSIQRVVVCLDSGFDAYDKLNPSTNLTSGWNASSQYFLHLRENHVVANQVTQPFSINSNKLDANN